MGKLRHKISPGEIDISNDLLGFFGKREPELVTIELVRYWQYYGGWHLVTPDRLEDWLDGMGASELSKGSWGWFDWVARNYMQEIIRGAYVPTDLFISALFTGYAPIMVMAIVSAGHTYCPHCGGLVHRGI